MKKEYVTPKTDVLTLSSEEIMKLSGEGQYDEVSNSIGWSELIEKI